MPSPTLAGVMCELAGAYDAEAAGRRASGRLGGVHQVTCVSYVHGIRQEKLESDVRHLLRHRKMRADAVFARLACARVAER